MIHSARLAKSSCGSPIKALPDYYDNNYIATSRPCVQAPAHLLVQQASQRRGANFRSAFLTGPCLVLLVLTINTTDTERASGGWRVSQLNTLSDAHEHQNVDVNIKPDTATKTSPNDQI